MFPPWLGHSLLKEVNRKETRVSRTDKPCPVSLLPTFEAGTRFSVVFSGSPTAVRKFNSNLVSHKEPFVVLCDALLGSLPTLKFDETITKPMY
jgi:hypothetical protein